MESLKKFLKKHRYVLAIGVILAIAVVFRFYNFENRWGLAYDQARDVIVAKEALRLHQPPLIGPFTSAGAFVYGPQWFWITMIMVLVFPFSVITPWVIQILLYVA